MTPVVLLVEDCDDIRDIMCEFLDEARFAVLEASNGLETLAGFAAATVALDLVLLDLALPVMDGLEFIREVAGDPRYARLPISMISATPKPLKLGRAALCLKKPGALAALSPHARSLCGQRPAPSRSVRESDRSPAP